MKKEKERPISEIAEEEFNRFQEKRKEIIASLKKRKGVIINTLGWNNSQNRWMVDIKENGKIKRVAAENKGLD